MDFFFGDTDDRRSLQLHMLRTSDSSPNQELEDHQEDEEAIDFDEHAVLPVAPAYS